MTDTCLLKGQTNRKTRYKERPGRQKSWTEDPERQMTRHTEGRNRKEQDRTDRQITGHTSGLEVILPEVNEIRVPFPGDSVVGTSGPMHPRDLKYTMYKITINMCLEDSVVLTSDARHPRKHVFMKQMSLAATRT